jgi:hypothetical protein
MKSISKEEIIELLKLAGYSVDLDKWESSGWIRFDHKFKSILDSSLIWYKDDEVYNKKNFERLFNNLFIIGQSYKLNQINLIRNL